MSYCAPIGLPHSQFLSWDQDDQDKALAFTVEQRRACSGCGTVTDDWFDEEGQDRVIPPYVAKTKYCPGCHELADTQAEIPEDRKSFTYVYLEPWSAEDGISVRQDRPSG